MSSLAAALRGDNQSGRPPIWLMRQAGRYMPQYRALRERHTILELFRSPELLTQVTLLPIELLDVDAAILFADILTPLDMLGIEWHIEERLGPVVEPCDLETLQLRPAVESVPYIAEGIRALKRELKVPLLGFCGGPFTVASYLIEGGTSKTLAKTRAMLYREPEKLHALLDLLADLSIDYLQLQIDAGVDAVQLFDSWAHWLSPEAFSTFALPYWRKIQQGVGEQVPLILFSRGSSVFAEQMASLKAPISLDWQCDVGHLRQKLGPKAVLQGNLDPCALFGSPEEAARPLLQQLGKDPAFIFNLGHGILPKTPLSHVQRLVEFVKGGQW